jgi:hypothetical protein
MFIALLLGGIAMCLNEALGVVFASILAGVMFACFLILFAVYWLAWMLRGHAVWHDNIRRADR